MVQWMSSGVGDSVSHFQLFFHWDLPLGLLVLDAFLSFCRVEELGEGFGCVLFARLLIS